MNTTETSHRAQLPRLLMALPPDAVIAVATRLAGLYQVADVTLPQSGLGLLQLKDGAFQEAYFPGEVPLATAHVTLSSMDGRRAEGAAQILHDSALLARAIAIIDAVVGNGLPEAADIEPLLREGMAQLLAQASTRKKILARTRVDFTLLGNTEEDEGNE